jgi:hypothetical protein
VREKPGISPRPEGAKSFADVRHQRHESRSLDGCARGSLKRCAASASLAGEQLVLIGAQLLEQTDVFVIDIGGAGATLPSAKPAAILSVASKLLPRHIPDFL